MPSSILAGTKSAAVIEPSKQMDRVEPGQTVTFEATVRHQGVESDPSELAFVMKSPGGVSTTYSYGADSEVVRNDVGKYLVSFQIPLDQSSVGVWTFAWQTTGEFETESLGEIVVSDAPDAVTLTLQDGQGTPVEAALISIYRGSRLVRQKRSGADGKVSLNLSDGLYTVETQLAGYRIPNVYLTVNGAAAAVITATRLVENQIPILKLCRLHGHILDMSGLPLQDVNIHIEPVGVSLRAFASGGHGSNPYNQAVAREKRTIRARNSDGYWEIDLLQESVVRVWIPSLNLSRVFRVPEVDQIDLAEVRSDCPLPRVGSTLDRVPYV